jgi:uncharacterized protein
LGADAPPAGAWAGEPCFATVEDGGRVVGGSFRSPPHQVLLTDMPEAAPPALARELSEAYRELPAVLGPPDLAEAFARAWVEIRGGVFRPGTEQRLYRLDTVTPLTGPGRLRPARPDEVALITAWAEEFARDVHARFGPGEERIAGWIERGHVFVWEDGDVPVCMAAAHGRTPRGARVGYVYTPPELRRRGYAGACVAELSQRLLDSGLDFCMLYADLSNSTTNALYQRMGYRPIGDVRDYHFDTEARS